LSKKNNREIYSDKDGKNYSKDTENGHFEVQDKRGKHQGSFDFQGKPTKPKDKSGKHDIEI